VNVIAGHGARTQSTNAPTLIRTGVLTIQRYFFAVAVGLLLWALLGRLIIQKRSWGLLIKAKGAEGVIGNAPLEKGTVSQRPDGSQLQVECYGPEGAPVIVLSHSWGGDRTEWITFNEINKEPVNRMKLPSNIR
jgi:hypothetical protein